MYRSAVLSSSLISRVSKGTEVQLEPKVKRGNG